MIGIAEDSIVVCPLPSWILGRSLFVPLYKHYLWRLVWVRVRVRNKRETYKFQTCILCFDWNSPWTARVARCVYPVK